MSKYKAMSFSFAIIAIILSNMMSANVAFEYCNNLWKIEYLGYSAPANTAFLLIIPYLIVIIVCIITSYMLRKKDLEMKSQQ